MVGFNVQNPDHMQQGGGGVLTQYIEQEKGFTQTEWQEKAAGLSEEQTKALHKLRPLTHREAALVQKVFEIVNPFKQGGEATADSLPDGVWDRGSETLDKGWKFAKCGLTVEAAWTDEALGLLKQGPGRATMTPSQSFKY